MDQNDQQQPDAEDGLATSFFPLPPAAYKNFTSRNFKLLKLIQEHEQDEDQQSWDELDAQQRMERQRAIIQEHGSALTKAKGGDEAEEAPQLPDWDLRMELEKPRVDWVVEDGFYNTFGQTWPVSAWALSNLTELFHGRGSEKGRSCHPICQRDRGQMRRRGYQSAHAVVLGCFPTCLDTRASPVS